MAPRISAVLLAAGSSRRMGAANKLLLEIDGVPLVRRGAETLLRARLGEIVVVLGHQRAAVAAALDGLDLRLVDNPDHETGQMSSVHAGLAALGGDIDGVMICLADQPELTEDDIDWLIDAFGRRGDKSIVAPTRDGARGNPIVLAAEHRADILTRQANLGCRHLVTRNPDLVMSAEAPNGHFFRDIDTEADYRAATGAPAK